MGKETLPLLPFIHHSFAVEQGLQESNERLEFLGDALINFFVAYRLYETLPKASEGELSRLKAYLVSSHYLADKTLKQGLQDKVRLSRNAERSGVRSNRRFLASTLEAYMAFYFLKKGFRKTFRFFDALFPELTQEDQLKALPALDPKTKLQEIIQGQGFSHPIYQTIQIGGEDHAPIYEASVRVEDHILGKGKGASKKEAQYAAAWDALKNLEEEDEEEKDR